MTGEQLHPPSADLNYVISWPFHCFLKNGGGDWGNETKPMTHFITALPSLTIKPFLELLTW